MGEGREEEEEEEEETVVVVVVYVKVYDSTFNMYHLHDSF